MNSIAFAITVFVLTPVPITTARVSADAAPLPQDRADVRDVQAAVTGNAIVDVTIVDGLGAPIKGVTVKLTGVVSYEAVSNDVGYVTFDALPEGRYDVVASLKGLAPSAPRVLDLPLFGVTSVSVTLKPHGQAPAPILSCGGFDPRSVKTMFVGAHPVLHVKVMDQHTLESVPLMDDVSGYLTTVNCVQVLESFKHSVRAPLAGSVVMIQQGGGRVDRGDYVDYHGSNKLPPLNIDDEYVLFVYVDSGGTYGIHAAEEGAFRVRNGGVDPLGSGGAASDWKGRTATGFFQALRALR